MPSSPLRPPSARGVLLLALAAIAALSVVYLSSYLPLKQRTLHLAWKARLLDGDVETRRVLSVDVPVAGGTFFRQVSLAVEGMAAWTVFGWLAFFHLDPGLVLFVWGAWHRSLAAGLALLAAWALVSARLEALAEREGRLHALHVLAFRYVPLFLVVPWALARLASRPRRGGGWWSDPGVRGALDLSLYHVPVRVFYPLALLALAFGLLGGAGSVVEECGDLRSAMEGGDVQRYYTTGLLLEARRNGYSEALPSWAELRELALLHLSPILTAEHLPREYRALAGALGLEGRRFDAARYALLVERNATFFTLTVPLLYPLVGQALSVALYFVVVWCLAPRRTDPSVFAWAGRAALGAVAAWLALETLDLGLALVLGDVGATTAPEGMLASLTLIARWLVVFGAPALAYAALRLGIPPADALGALVGSADRARTGLLIATVLAALSAAAVGSAALEPVLDRLVLSPMRSQVQSHPELYYDTLVRAGLDISRFLADVPEGSVSVREVGRAELESNLRFPDGFAERSAPVLSTVRLWDRERTQVRADRNMGEVPYLDIGNEDFLVRDEGGRMAPYWAVELPLKRDKVVGSDFYNTRQFYTHSEPAFIAIDATTGRAIEAAFPTDEMYFGVHPVLAQQESYLTDEGAPEVGNATYRGRGLEVAVPDVFFYDATYLGVLPDALRRWRVPPNETFYWRWAEAIDRGDVARFRLLIMRRLDVRVRSLLPALASGGAFDILGNDPYPVSYRNGTWFVMHGFVALDPEHVPLTSMEVTGGVGERRRVEAFARYAVVALGDIYTGEVELYAPFDDPLSRLLRSSYPELRRELPPEVRRQLRYPERFFVWRAHKHFDYHPTPEEFYKGLDFFKEDPSQREMYHTPLETEGGDVEFAGILPALLDKGTAEQAQTETGLVGLYVVRNSFLRDDLDGYGRITLYRFPKGATDAGGYLFYSYQAIERSYLGDARYQTWARLKQESTIKPGNMLLCRIGGHWLYVRPIYLETGQGVTRLEKVVVMQGAYLVNASRDEYRVGLGDTIEGALADLIAVGSAPAAANATEAGSETPAAPAGEAEPGAAEAERAALSELRSLLDEKVACLRAGDLACAVRAEARMKEAEAKLAGLFARGREGGAAGG